MDHGSIRTLTKNTDLLIPPYFFIKKIWNKNEIV